MGPLYKKYISSGINQNSEVPNKNAAGETQNDVMNRKGQAFKKAETNYLDLHAKFKNFKGWNDNIRKMFNTADSTNRVPYDNAIKAFNKSSDSINKVHEDYANSILNPKKNPIQNSTPLLQGAYERGDAYVEDYAGNALMQGLQTLGNNVARQFNDPANKSKRQLNRVNRREERMLKKPKLNNDKFKAKTADIKARSDANLKQSTIDSRYKEWLISNKRNKGLEDLTNENQSLTDQEAFDAQLNKPIVQKQKTAKEIAAAKKSRDEYEASLKNES